MSLSFPYKTQFPTDRLEERHWFTDVVTYIDDAGTEEWMKLTLEHEDQFRRNPDEPARLSFHKWTFHDGQISETIEIARRRDYAEGRKLRENLEKAYNGRTE